jgi:hypothetical protein
MAEETKLPEPVKKISAGAMALVEAVMRRKDIDPALYNSEYFADDKEYTVALFYKRKKASVRGSDPEHPDYEIVISRKDNKLVRISQAR